MSKRPSETSIWLRPEPGGRRRRLTRDKISATALAIADAEGFEAVSMRRIAARLGMSTMSLYYYVRTKADLVALMDDALMAEILVPAGKVPRGWREGIATIARRTRDVFARHPWALVLMRGAPPGPNAMRHFEQSLEALEDAPLSVEGKLALLQLVDDFVFGHSLRAAEVGTWFSDPDLAKSAEALSHELLKTGAFPRTAALFERRSSHRFVRRARWLVEDRFERALAALLDGAARRLPRTMRSSRRHSHAGRSPLVGR